MRIELNPQHTEDALDHLRDLIIEMGALHGELRSHFVKDRDGYPTSSMGGGPPTSDYDEELDEEGEPVLDEHGNPKKIPLPPRSDPVARIVIDRDEGIGSTGQTLAKFVHKIQEMRRLALAAVGDAKRALQPPIKITPPDELWCENCLRAKVHSPRAAEGKYCSWCRDNKTGDKYPSPRMVDAHSRGTLTAKHRAEIERREAEERKARKAEAKRGAA